MPDQVKTFKGLRWVLRRFGIGEIQIPKRRPINEATVEKLRQSIQTIGLLQPIAVVIEYNKAGDEVPVLCWGAHRLEALKRIDPAQTVQAYDVTDLSALDRKIAECDENLARQDLTAAERKASEKARLAWMKSRAAKAEAADKAAKAERESATKEREKARSHKGRSSDAPCAETPPKDKGGRPKTERRAEVERVAAETGKSVSQVNRDIAKAEGREPAPPVEDLDYSRLCRAWDMASADARRRFILYIDAANRQQA